MTNEFEMEMNPEHIHALVADIAAAEHMIRLAKEAASTPEDDAVIEWHEIKLEAMREVVETIQLNHAVTNHATFKVEIE